MNYEKAWTTHSTLVDVVFRCRATYEKLIANGADVHRYYNLLGTTMGCLNLLKTYLTKQASDEIIEECITCCKAKVHEFARFVSHEVDKLRSEFDEDVV